MLCLIQHIGGSVYVFPYFRGRQYELLALKELAQKGLISKYVIPVVEPIKISPTLKTQYNLLKSRLKICNDLKSNCG